MYIFFLKKEKCRFFFKERNIVYCSIVNVNNRKKTNCIKKLTKHLKKTKNVFPLLKKMKDW